MRIIILHDTPPNFLDSLKAVVDTLRGNHLLCGPGDFEPACAAARTRYILSFDDGFASNLAAARELASLGVSALFFVCPGLITLSGNAQAAAVSEAFFGGRPVPAGARLLTWDEISEIVSLGHEVGAHGMTHARLSELNGASLAHEITGAGEALAERFGVHPKWYAYSYGDIASISAEALAIVRRHYRYCRSGVRGINGPTTNRHALRGEEVRLDGPAAYRHLVLEGGLDLRYRDARLLLDSMAAGGTINAGAIKSVAHD